ncbi:Scr1 family TA system antitoxin-like transcriptional regulator, partial [Streptomyces sp. YGL11-2]|uniref:Scr1 family TA system antitoxin-like transcriptional regulator n=1 Tax=Streptomyces sp. YGL11-2 TaxID=3414028 RepID=UPI003CF0AA69
PPALEAAMARQGLRAVMRSGMTAPSAAELEDLAVQADIYASQVIPGILQTSGYAHAVMDGSGRWRTEREVRTFAELRSQRQNVLTRDNPLFLATHPPGVTPRQAP